MKILAKSLKDLSDHMFNVAVEMDYFGGFNEIAQHARELSAASLLVKEWAEGIENLNKKEE